MNEMTSPSVVVARDFLQTVLIVDDRAEFGAVGKPEHSSPSGTDGNQSEVGTAPAADSPSEANQTSTPVLGEASTDVPHGELKTPSPEALAEARGTDELNAKVIIDRFASLGLVCGVIRPEQDESINAIIGPAALRADILILDWRFDKDNGEGSLEIIRHIIADVDDRHRLRLIVIYTGVPDLAAIAERVARILEEPRTHGKTRVIAGPVHITVLAKPDTPVDHDLRSAVVPFEELPSRVIDEFAAAVRGLMPNVVLSSFAAIRRNTHRVLKRFSQDLDAAYLGHRMLLRHPEDAERLVSDLMAQEISAVLDNASVGEYASASSAEWLISESVLSARSVEPVDRFARQKGEAVEDYALSLVQHGVYSDISGLSKADADRAHRWTSKIYAVDDTDAMAADLRFASLVKSKSRYENPTPELRLGVFVRDSVTDQFMLCIQPLCDSVRLVGDTQFPFLLLKSVEDKFDFVIDYHDQVHKLRLDLKIRDLRMIVLSPTNNPPGVVKADRDEATNEWVFKSRHPEDMALWWVGELREGWAHKYANKFSDSVSRVGMDDSEWARRSGMD